MKALSPLGWLYGSIVRARNRYYDVRGATELDVPVVSVGNLTVGGSGKTPLVATIASLLLDRGMPVAVLSRGYGREGSAPYTLVSDGERVLVDARTGGDEPVELARQVPGLVVAVGADRVAVANRLLDDRGKHVIVLDDGFQHRRLARDVDLVCFDCGEPVDDLRLLPAGRLREPLENVRRASAVVMTRWREDCEAPAVGEVPVIRAVTRIVGFRRVDVEDDTPLGPDSLRDRRVGLVVGIARPERVRADLDAPVVHFVTRRDHHRWSESELSRIVSEAEAAGATALLTTGKDAVKMAFVQPAAIPVYRIVLASEVVDLETLRGMLAFPPL